MFEKKEEEKKKSTILNGVKMFSCVGKNSANPMIRRFSVFGSHLSMCGDTQVHSQMLLLAGMKQEGRDFEFKYYWYKWIFFKVKLNHTDCS